MPVAYTLHSPRSLDSKKATPLDKCNKGKAQQNRVNRPIETRIRSGTDYLYSKYAVRDEGENSTIKTPITVTLHNVDFRSTRYDAYGFPVAKTGRQINEKFADKYTGLIGYAFLREFNLTYNFPLLIVQPKLEAWKTERKTKEG